MTSRCVRSAGGNSSRRRYGRCARAGQAFAVVAKVLGIRKASLANGARLACRGCTLHKEPVTRGIWVGKERVRRRMQRRGIHARTKPQFVLTTDSRRSLPATPESVQRRSILSPIKFEQRWQEAQPKTPRDATVENSGARSRTATTRR